MAKPLMENTCKLAPIKFFLSFHTEKGGRRRIEISHRHNFLNLLMSCPPEIADLDTSGHLRVSQGFPMPHGVRGADALVTTQHGLSGQLRA